MGSYRDDNYNAFCGRVIRRSPELNRPGTPLRSEPRKPLLGNPGSGTEWCCGYPAPRRGAAQAHGLRGLGCLYEHPFASRHNRHIKREFSH